MSTSDRFVFLALLLAPGCTAETTSTPPNPPTSVTQSAETTATAADNRPFDRRAAQATLKAVDIHPCVAPGDDGATGHVMVTFGPDGQVTRTAVDDGPTSGTATGACIAARFRGAAVPAFTGEPIRVGYSFVLR